MQIHKTNFLLWKKLSLKNLEQNSGGSDDSRFSKNLPKVVEGEHFAQRTENIKIFVNFMDRDVENLFDHDWQKIQELVELKADEVKKDCSRYLFWQIKTLHCAEH